MVISIETAEVIKLPTNGIKLNISEYFMGNLVLYDKVSANHLKRAHITFDLCFVDAYGITVTSLLRLCPKV